jgi:hypothetical protein
VTQAGSNSKKASSAQRLMKARILLKADVSEGARDDDLKTAPPPRRDLLSSAASSHKLP